MSILWAGGEDIDFPLGTQAINGGTYFTRSGWSRCTASAPSGAMSKSTPFTAGAVTSAWLRFYYGIAGGVSGAFQVGFGLSGTSKCLGIGMSTTAGKVGLYTYDGTTHTLLASESGTSMSPGGSAPGTKFDMQVSNYGASATVNVYAGGVLIITFTGNVALSGMTNFDSVFLWGGGTFQPACAEFIVSTTDTRALAGLATLALNGAGTTQAWTNPTYSNINGAAYSDANPTYSNTPGQNNQFTTNAIPSGSYAVRVVKQTLRAALSTGAATAQIKVGFNSGGTVAFGAGAAKTPAGVFSTMEQFDFSNPVTGAAWAQTDLTGLQLNHQSA